MSAPQAFPEKLSDCHRLLAQYAEELAAFRQSAADYQRKHVDQQKNVDLQGAIDSITMDLEQLREKHQRALHEIELFRRWIYGPRRERFTEDPRQKHLFDMAALVKTPPVAAEGSEADPQASEDQKPAEQKPGEVRRKKRVERKLCLDALPQVHHEMDVDGAEKSCSHCSCDKVCIGDDVTRVLELIPAKLEVHNYHRRKFACTCGKSGVTTPSPPAVPIPKSIAGASLLASLIVTKTGDHLPTFRSEDILVRYGLHIPRSTLCDWMHRAALLLLPFAAFVTRRILSEKVLWTDDTHVMFFDRHGRAVKTKASKRSLRRGRLWPYIAEGTSPYTTYDFTVSRDRDGPKAMLKGWSGFLHADAYSGYNAVIARSNGGIIEVACWAHARRYFEHALSNDRKLCSIVLSWIRQLYDIEDRARSMSCVDRMNLRLAESAPILKRFGEWLKMDERCEFNPNDLPSGVLPKSQTARAIQYARYNWRALNTYTTDGRLSIDNNLSERTVRAIAVGRKNWQFIGSEAAGCRMAVLFSIMANAKRHHIEPYAYVRDLLMQMTWLLAHHDVEVLELEETNGLSADEFRAYSRTLADKLPEDSLTPLLPDHWAQAHPQHVLQHRIDEARRLANRKRDDRTRRRAADSQELAPLNQPS